MTTTDTIQIQCPDGCSSLTIADVPGLWQCPRCHQRWDRYEQGTRVWTKVQQADHRALWAQALRSGRYQQGKEHLRRTHPDSDTDYHTSTGVAVDICPFTSWTKGENNLHTAASGNDRANALTPTLTVMNWLGLSSAQGHFNDLPEHPQLVGNKVSQNNLVYLNDRLGIDFPTIASLIESDPPGMFLQQTGSRH